MILPLNHMSVAMDMTFNGFYQNAVGIQIVLMDLATLPQSNVGLSRGVMAPTTY